MKILVCLKQILDPEIPLRDFRVDPVRREAEQGIASLVTNIFCENALETARQLRDSAGGEITAISFGVPSAEDTLRKALALKVDHACLVCNDGPPHPSPAATARVLAAAAKKLGGFDLVVVGREAGDWGAGQTGGLLAEELDLPYVAFVDAVQTTADGVELRRQTESGWELWKAQFPLVISVTNSDHNVPRYPMTRDILMSSRKPLMTFQLTDLGLSADDLASNETEVVELFVPTRHAACEFVTGDSLDAKITEFATRIAAVVK
ncbi:MAG: electron transfer flavoprotein subunit beta/FixA family protein [Pirellulaceae bacterium]